MTNIHEDGRGRKPEYSTGIPVDLWTPFQRRQLIKMGVGEGSLRVFKEVRLGFDGSYESSREQCRVEECGPTQWRIGQETFEPHSFAYVLRSAGLHSYSFLNREMLATLHTYNRGERALALIEMNPRDFLAVGTDFSLKSSRYRTLDLLPLDGRDSRDEWLGFALQRENPSVEVLQEIGRTAQNWWDVIDML